MSPERWRRIEEVYHSAQEQAPDQRAAFLAEACGGDDELRREVESLLRHGDSPEALVDRPAWEAAGELLDTRTWKLDGRPPSPTTKSSRSSARAAWEWCIRPATAAWAEAWL